MPLVRIFLIEGKTVQYKQAISDAVHRAMVDAIAIPSDDRFQIISEQCREDLVYDRGYLGIQRSDDIVMIQITLGSWRSAEQKKGPVPRHHGQSRGAPWIAPAGRAHRAR